MARVAFHRSLYSREAVEAAAAAYARLATITVTEDGDDVLADVQVPPTSTDGLAGAPGTRHTPASARQFATDVVDSFANHALCETVVRARRTA